MGKKLFFKKELIDASTGEYLTAIVYIPEAKDREFAKVYRLFSEKVVEDLVNRVITGGEAKILLWFLAKTVELPTQSDMWIPVDYKELGEIVGLHKDNVYKYIKQLVKKGYLEQYKNRQTVFRLKPDYVYKGVLVKYKEAEPDF